MHTAKIVAITQPLIEGVKTAEEFISYAARVSNPSNQMNMETAEKLLRYCMRNQHWSIFEMVNIVMEIETTRDIGRQILRHQFKFQEFSQRYADPLSSDLGFELKELRLQDVKNRQNSLETDDIELAKSWEAMQKNVIYIAEGVYKQALKYGIAKEQARAVLPEGLTVSRLYANGTLRNWIHYCHLRMKPETQKEHRLIAESAWKEITGYFDFLSRDT